MLCFPVTVIIMLLEQTFAIITTSQIGLSSPTKSTSKMSSALNDIKYFSFVCWKEG